VTFSAGVMAAEGCPTEAGRYARILFLLDLIRMAGRSARFTLASP